MPEVGHRGQLVVAIDDQPLQRARAFQARYHLQLGIAVDRKALQLDQRAVHRQLGEPAVAAHLEPLQLAQALESGDRRKALVAHDLQVAQPGQPTEIGQHAQPMVAVDLQGLQVRHALEGRDLVLEAIIVGDHQGLKALQVLQPVDAAQRGIVGKLQVLELGQTVEVEMLERVVVGDPQADDGREPVEQRAGALERAGARIGVVYLIAAGEVLGHDDLLLAERVENLSVEVWRV